MHLTAKEILSGFQCLQKTEELPSFKKKKKKKGSHIITDNDIFLFFFEFHYYCLIVWLVMTQGYAIYLSENV